MTRANCLSALIFTLALGACATVPGASISPLGSASLSLADGTAAGTARLEANGDKVTLSVSLTGFPAGEHAMHLHTSGACVAPDFNSAGGHLNPEGKQHGAHNPMGSHLGDLPNVTTDSSGAAEVSVTVPGTLAQLEPILFDTDGTAIVVHAQADDMMTDPTGNAGPRLACGVLTRN